MAVNKFEMSPAMRKEMSVKMREKYGYYLTEEDCKDLVEDIVEITEGNTVFATPLMEWLHGKSTFTDVEVNGFSLTELAWRLNEDCPNIPVAVLILGLEAMKDNTFHGLPAIADIPCLADPRLFVDRMCERAVCSVERDGGEYDNHWMFLSMDAEDDELVNCQAWQVLLLNPRLIIHVGIQHEESVELFLQTDDSYLVILGEEEV